MSSLVKKVESDAEKVVLKEASKKIKPKLYKKIVGHSFIISLFIPEYSW